MNATSDAAGGTGDPDCVDDNHMIFELDTAAEALAEWLAGCKRPLLLTGAGISTGSGIGDYRDAEGAYKRPPPVTIQKFLGSTLARQRYWARSLFGWPAFASAKPNPAHQALAELHRRWRPCPVITQNVDGLHQAAHHDLIYELHGNLHRVLCLDCGHVVARETLQRSLRDNNAWLLEAQAELRPDGDAALSLENFEQIWVPDCERCGGLLKPAVVFFGDAVPKSTVGACFAALEAADALLIVGSSVMIHSSFRFCRAAREQGKPVVAVNLGRTRADPWLAAKFELPCEALLPLVSERLCPVVV